MEQISDVNLDMSCIRRWHGVMDEHMEVVCTKFVKWFDHSYSRDSFVEEPSWFAQTGFPFGRVMIRTEGNLLEE